MKLICYIIIALLMISLVGCGPQINAEIACTTLPVYEFTVRLCHGTDIRVVRLVTENVSCLHDYTLQTRQMQAIESAQLIVINGAGLEEFLEDALHRAANVVDCSYSLHLEEGHHHAHDHDGGHVHAEDPHIWLSPENAKVMAHNIFRSLAKQYPAYRDQFLKNLEALFTDLDALQTYGEMKLKDLSCREIITFHDGFTYLAESFDLNILRAIEEESGSEASAAELIELISLVREHQIPAIFTEANGSVSAAGVISAETNIPVYALDMAMSGDSYFDSMYRNIDVLWEALQ